jgi:hypothetical protein
MMGENIHPGFGAFPSYLSYKCFWTCFGLAATFYPVPSPWNHISTTYFSFSIAGTTGMYHRVWLIYWDGISLFARLASNHELLDLCLPSSWDYRYEPYRWILIPEEFSKHFGPNIPSDNILDSYGIEVCVFRILCYLINLVFLPRMLRYFFPLNWAWRKRENGCSQGDSIYFT